MAAEVRDNDRRASQARDNDPRGHDDGDIIVDDPERASILRVEIKKLIIDLRRNHLAVQAAILELANEMGYAPLEIAAELEAEARVLRHLHTTVSSERQRTDTKE